MNRLKMKLCDRHDGRDRMPSIFTESIQSTDTPDSLAEYAKEVLEYYKCTSDTELIVYLSSSKMYLDALLTAASAIGVAKLCVGIWQRTSGDEGFYHIVDMAPLPVGEAETDTYAVRLCAMPETRKNSLAADDPNNPNKWPAVIPNRLEDPFDLKNTQSMAEKNTAQYAGERVLLYVNGADFVFVPVLNALLGHGCIVTLQHYNPNKGKSCFHTLTKQGA